MDYLHYRILSNPKLYKESAIEHILDSSEKALDIIKKIRVGVTIRGVVSEEDKVCVSLLLNEVQVNLENIFKNMRVLF